MMANEKRLELIDRKELVKTMCRACNNECCEDPCEPGECFMYDDINNAPTVDAVEVVHGRWVYDSGSGKYFCSDCDEYALSFKKDTIGVGELYEVCLTDYCPNCGADMRERSEGE